MSRYAIWNKKDPVYTPKGEKLTAEEWIARYPVLEIPSVICVCAGNEINGGYFNTLGNMIDAYTIVGCDFSACVTPEDKIAAIEAFEDKREADARADAKAAAEREAANAELNAMSLASIAAQLEYQNMMTLEDVEG